MVLTTIYIRTCLGYFPKMSVLSCGFLLYIKVDAICDKELTKWTAKNVADFIASTDCADKAELFAEQVCSRHSLP